MVGQMIFLQIILNEFGEKNCTKFVFMGKLRDCSTVCVLFIFSHIYRPNQKLFLKLFQSGMRTE